MIKKATISECGNYRYSLSRIWDKTKPKVMFIMLNPSTADGIDDDPTIRRCINFAKGWGYGGLYVGNIFSYRCTKPMELRKAKVRLQGRYHFKHLLRMVKRVDKIILGWGAYNQMGMALEEFLLLNELPKEKLYHLGLTKWGNPRHPLFLLGNTKPIKYPWNENKK